MKKGILVSVVVLLAAVSIVQAQEAELHGSIGAEFSSKYIWRGFDVYDDHATIHPSVNLDLFGTGFGLNATGHRANSSGFENTERWDYTLYYLGRAFEAESYMTSYRLGYTYFNYPDMSSHTVSSMDIHEVHGIFSFPKLLPIEGLVPTYCLVKLMPVNSGTIVGARSPSGGTSSGFAHIFMLDYGLPVTCPLTGNTQTLNLHTECVYNDGVSPVGTNVDHDWSNAVFGVSTTYSLSNNLSLTPGVYYQSSWDDSVNPEDELWTGVSLAYNF
ncbi:MAG: hypothetical protein ACYTBP_07090 [Planctomycetota bacterium]